VRSRVLYSTSLTAITLARNFGHMSKSANLQRLLDAILVAVIRAPSGDRLVEVAEALIAGGVTNLEVTFTVPQAHQVIRRLREHVGQRALVGAGTVLDIATAELAIEAGSQFVVSPITDPALIDYCKSRDCLVMPGALTPTEIHTAWKSGADIVKVFPADVAGPGYFKAIHGPLPEVRLMPTGGVNLQTVGDFLVAGACALGVGGALVSPKLIEQGDFAEIESRAKQYVEAVRAARTAS